MFIFYLFIQIGGHTKDATTKLLQKNLFLYDVSPKALRKSFRALEKLCFEKRDIRTHPKLLLQPHFELLNNFQRLLEVGFHEVTAYRLANAKEILSQSVHFNRCFNFLPANENILNNIFAIAMVSTDSIDDLSYNRDMKLETVHRMALKKYMLDHLGYSVKDIDEMWCNYPPLRNRSLKSIDTATRLLELIYNKPMKDLPKLSLTMHPEEIEELLAVDSVCGVDVRKVMILAPRCNLERLRSIRQICRSYNVPDYALAYSPKLFFLKYETLQNRLEMISKLNRGKQFLQHVAIGRVILFMDRLRSHLESKSMHFNAVFNDKFIE